MRKTCCVMQKRCCAMRAEKQIVCRWKWTSAHRRAFHVKRVGDMLQTRCKNWVPSKVPLSKPCNSLIEHLNKCCAMRKTCCTMQKKCCAMHAEKQIVCRWKWTSAHRRAFHVKRVGDMLQTRCKNWVPSKVPLSKPCNSLIEHLNKCCAMWKTCCVMQKTCCAMHAEKQIVCR